MTQVFIVLGHHAEALGHTYAFDSADEAMEFVGYVQEHTKDEDIMWEVVSLTIHTARQTYDAFVTLEG